MLFDSFQNITRILNNIINSLFILLFISFKLIIYIAHKIKMSSTQLIINYNKYIILQITNTTQDETNET